MEKGLGIKILIVILIIIILGLASYIIYDKFLNNTNNENSQNKIENVSQEQNTINTNEISIDPYAKYHQFKWLRNNTCGYTEKFEIINSKLYYINDTSKEEVTSIIGNPKYVNGIINGGILNKIFVITEQGTVWLVEVGRGDYTELHTNFIKLNIPGTILEMTHGIEGARGYAVGMYQYYLTSDGKLINENGKTYEEINGNHILGLGNFGDAIYIGSDETISYYTTDINYEYVKDTIGNNLKAKQVICQSSTTRNDLLSDGVLERFYVVTQNNQLLYFDTNTDMIAHEYTEALNKTVIKIENEEIPDQYGGHSHNIVITLSGNIKIELIDISTAYDISTKSFIE